LILAVRLPPAPPFFPYPPLFRSNPPASRPAHTAAPATTVAAGPDDRRLPPGGLMLICSGVWVWVAGLRTSAAPRTGRWRACGLPAYVGTCGRSSGQRALRRSRDAPREY